MFYNVSDLEHEDSLSVLPQCENTANIFSQIWFKAFGVDIISLVNYVFFFFWQLFDKLLFAICSR